MQGGASGEQRGAEHACSPAENAAAAVAALVGVAAAWNEPRRKQGRSDQLAGRGLSGRIRLGIRWTGADRWCGREGEFKTGDEAEVDIEKSTITRLSDGKVFSL